MTISTNEISERLQEAKDKDLPMRDLLELKGEVLTAARALINKAEREKRNLTASEQADSEQFRSYLEKIGGVIDAKHERLEREKREAGEFLDSQRGGIAGGGEKWRTASGKRVEVFKPEQRMAPAELPSEYRDLSFGQFVRAMVLGARTEPERRALAEGADSTGGATVPAPLAAQLIDALRAKARVIQAGAQTVKMDSETLSLARLEGDPTGTWHAENTADFSDSAPNFARLKFTAFTLVSLVKISRELLADSVNINAGLQNAFAQALAVEVDKAALIGTGSGQPKGIANWTNVGSVDMGTNGAALTNYDPILDAVNAMLTANAGDPTAAIMHPRSLTAFNKLKDDNSVTMARPPSITSLPFLPTTTVPIDDTHGTADNASRVFVGDYSGLLIGMRQEVRIDVLRERYAENYQYAFLASLRCDVVLEHDEQFAIIEGIVPAS